MTSHHLNALEAGFLQAEDADGHTSLALGAVALLSGPAPSHDHLLTVLAERAARVPRCHEVLRETQMDLVAPRWVEDEGFDIAHHVRRVAVTAPGDDAALFAVVAQVMERRLDRSRPLWECWVIDGLAGDRWAMLIKIHHCVADGVAATAMLEELCDDWARTAPAADTSEPTTKPSGNWTMNPVGWMQSAWRMSARAPRAALRVASGATELATALLEVSPKSFTGPLSDLRTYSAAKVQLDDVRMIGERLGVTVNDVALAAITDSFRSAMLRRGLTPRAHSLRTAVPVSLRSADALHIPDNRIAVTLPQLPVEHADPLRRLQAVHDRMMSAKSGGQVSVGALAVAAAGLLPYAVTAPVVRLLTRLPQRGVITVATNVPGPRRRLHIAGCEVLTLLPVPPIAMHLRTAIAILSYCDELVFGVIGDADSPLSPEELARGIEAGVAHLATIAAAARHSRRVGNLLLLAG
ncbi:wax ester/triacylglycerol synthase family O-acyltransferase [Mycolicibacterium fluoranthenivorans]|uniref:Diacylglycerol O-acyltransferase n=1 Tax=Mycolicibacterium fluoranthenivorans TaxID=258505 RepID=A0A7X5U1B1_9MYCO|nr:wax ester/triacylglycerol synthase family O-acyltransferase [Mycolicibacterium fluoranthenivorans]MCV7354836.1 wax ester/triacylglycerol synthase family O-acyltransferase [Mycolicibacterium fluoranthenivorans]NIH96577.1 diacylglycerol O-acyltransferase [Mycolicibacterium fluoranthenivorans]